MAVQAAAQLLDELMGRNRNSLPDDKGNELNWDDPDVCKYYMVRFCPHDLFVNTKADLGPCLKVHDDELKDLYEKSNSYKKQLYEDEFVRFCQSMINDVEKKIKKGRQRLSLAQKGDMPMLTPAQQVRNEEQISLLSDKINKLIAEAEEQGTQGNVEQAQGLMKLCDQLKDEREQLRKQVENSHWQQTAEMAAAQEKQMEVCDICGAFLIVGDAQQRIDDHLMGKQHMGYARLKVSIEEIMAARQKAKEEREKRREDERRDREVNVPRTGGNSSRIGGSSPRNKDSRRERKSRYRSRSRERRDYGGNRGGGGGGGSGGRERYNQSANYQNRHYQQSHRNRDNYRGDRERERDREYRDRHRKERKNYDRSDHRHQSMPSSRDYRRRSPPPSSNGGGEGASDH